ncbi:hypothetical protein TanjilG_32117 [Lupinus angustifolius]|uniref:Amine oxidase domain-containing protein n=1 Tax=Lupinus angustifolius TaxID=3871 RepID=A0A1J7HK15_LUPAN|nr:hypothetical protein TanjilG_32117 [Lupinus angustifolius]
MLLRGCLQCNMVIEQVTYPNMMEFFESLGVDMELSNMSFSVSLDKGQGVEWGSPNGLSSLFAQKSNALNPYFWQMIREIINYLDVLENNPDIDGKESLEQFIKTRGYSELFQKAYLIPICGSIWPCPSEGVMSFSAYSVLLFCRNHHLLQLFGRPQWLTVKWRSQNYVKKVKEELVSNGCQIIVNCEVNLVSTAENGCVVNCKDGSQEIYDGCIMAVHAPNALRILGDEATQDERRILGAFQYVYSNVFLHRDKNFMPKNPAAWSAWNFLGSNNKKVCVTYWLNVLQNIEETSLPFLVTLNPDRIPENTSLKWSTGHPFPSVAAMKASYELDHIQGKRKIWFSGAYQGWHDYSTWHSWKMLFPSDQPKTYGTFLEGTRSTPFCDSIPEFLYLYWLLEEGGTMFTFEGTEKKSILKSVLRVHNPQFYWKVMTQADLGLADAYINGDFTFVDKDAGLLNFFLILIANRDSNASNSKSKNRGWWTPVFFTAGLASAKFFIEHISRKNTLTQTRRNISRHYDLNKDEDLKESQMRKISLLIEKARIDKKHEILEIGCGWGSLAIEVVKRTGCKYTGITLSKEQLKLVERRVKDAGLQDHIKFLLCDYRQLPKTYKFDRIISCEMIEAVGHEYMDEFFGCCESLLANDGLLVLQFTSIPDERYDEYRRSSDFIKEYIFPGGCLPCLSRITSAMVATSRLCIEHIENIGIHYYQTLRCWRKNFLERQNEIMALGFNEKFIRTWEYYFDYCVAGFKSRTLGTYQVVFSRPGNVTAFIDPYQSWPSAC